MPENMPFTGPITIPGGAGGEVDAVQVPAAAVPNTNVSVVPVPPASMKVTPAGYGNPTRAFGMCAGGVSVNVASTVRLKLELPLASMVSAGVSAGTAALPVSTAE